jgi:predicted DNA-binding transcriptional regulator AlpA
MTNLTTADIAELLGLDREYVTDRVVKRPDFPPPVLVLSRKTRLWSRAHIEQWQEAQAIRAAGRSARPSRGSRSASGSSDPGGR